MTDRKRLANQIEQTWMEYNAAVVSRLHPNQVKETLVNIVINNIQEILAALRTENDPAKTARVVVGDESEPRPRKVRK